MAAPLSAFLAKAMTTQDEKQVGDQVLDGIRYREEKIIVDTLKLTEAVGPAAFHLGVITAIAALGWS